MARRVLLLADNPYFGGVTAHLLAVIDAFAARNDIDLELAVLPGRSNDATLIDAAKDRGCPVHTIPMRHRFDPAAIRSLRTLALEGKFDLILVHGYRGAAVAALARTGLPIVGTSHGVAVAPALRTRLWQRLHLRRLAKAAAVVAVSKHVAQWLAENGVPPERIRVVYNGFPPHEDGPTASRRDLGVPADAMAVLYCGRLAAGKGLPLLIEAARGIPEVFLVFVGDGPDRAALEAEAKQLAVPATFVGQVTDPYPYYRMADLIALPSEMEALPSVLIEAASQKRPAIATAVGGIPEIVKHEETGLLVPPGDAEALRDALERMTDQTRRVRYGLGAFVRWRNNFTLDTMADGLAAVYAEVVDRTK